MHSPTHDLYDASFAAAYDRIFSDDAENALVADFLANSFAGVKVLLELGVGTGRVAIPLAQRGFDIVGVDRSAAMLDHLRGKLTPQIAVRLVEADMSALPNDLRAEGVYCVLGSLACLLSSASRRRMFRGAREAVDAGALLIVEVYNPYAIRAMHAAQSGGATHTVAYPTGGVLTSEYWLDGDRWRASHDWREDGIHLTFEESVALIEPDELVREAAPSWSPRALVGNWMGEQMGQAKGAMMIVVFEASEKDVR